VAGCRVLLDHAALCCLINQLVGAREEILCLAGLARGHKLASLLDDPAHLAAATLVENALVERGAMGLFS